jgi:hypothetical protein
MRELLFAGVSPGMAGIEDLPQKMDDLFWMAFNYKLSASVGRSDIAVYR